MHGMLLHAFTRVYFNDETAANAQDPVLQSVPAARRATLVAQRQDTSTGAGALYRFDIHMQGSAETVFFDL
jgi:protocatechuate 3,4-dioxygenase, alpha subunit